MARYTGARCKLSRREGIDLQLTSRARSLESKCKAKNVPGQRSVMGGGMRTTEYCKQLRMKQAIKRYYGILERQFRNCYEKASNQRGDPAKKLVEILESRLDNVVYRLGFARTRAEARQIVTHKFISVNGKTVNIPSYAVSVGDVVELREKFKSLDSIKTSLEVAEQVTLSEWLVKNDKFSGTFKRYPDIAELPPEFKFYLVVWFYSK